MVDFRLYLVTNRHLCAPVALVSVVSEACAAGVRCVQLREKDLDERSHIKLSAELSAVTRKTSASLIVNAHGTDPLRYADFDGVQFPESTNLGDALRQKHPGRTLGASSHSLESALSKAGAGVDFVTFGPIFDTPSKRSFGAPQGINRLAAVCSEIHIPVVAIGGITPENARSCIDAGAGAVALMGAIMQSTDVTATVRQFETALGRL